MPEKKKKTATKKKTIKKKKTTKPKKSHKGGTLAKYKGGEFKYNEIYFFHYMSELAKQKKIHVFDRAPLVIFLDLERKDGKVLGINLHWIPRQFRRTFVQLVNDFFTEEMIQSGKKRPSPYFPRLFYQTIKSKTLFKRMSYMAIRLYFLSNIKDVVPIPREWWDTLFTSKMPKRFRSRFVYKSKNYKH
jgi:hypothetical protein